jgi:hypothetical protein
VDAAQQARWLAAPLVAAILREIASDRGCHPHQLGATLVHAIEGCVLAWVAEREGFGDEPTPVRDMHAEHPSAKPTVRAPRLPRGVKRERR